jgi:nucleotide-binding universal stress UspA family protein
MKVLICSDTGSSGEMVLGEAQKFLSMLPPAEIYIHMVLDASAIAVTPEGTNFSLITALEEDISLMQSRAKEIFKGAEIILSDEYGSPVDSILAKVTDVHPDLVIIGTHGRTGMNRLLIGSVAENVLRNINCNTLVVPMKHKA